jgi:hypothetical protein
MFKKLHTKELLLIILTLKFRGLVIQGMYDVRNKEEYI